MRRLRQQRGNTFLETALIFLPLFAVIFAILDYGLVIFIKSTMQHAVREGRALCGHLSAEIRDGA
jgi:Flp pilus assembly protein TadG